MFGAFLHVNFLDLTPSAYVCVPPVFKDESEAKIALAYHALFPGSIESKAAGLMNIFKRLEWNEFRVAYVELLKAQLEAEFAVHGAPLPVYDIQPESDKEGKCELPYYFLDCMQG